MNCEQDYEAHKADVEKLASYYKKIGVKMLLMKGYGLSLNYPQPSHRPMGDIDVYLYGQGALADKKLSESLGVPVKLNSDKHSQFTFGGTAVENHAYIVGVPVHPCLKELNAALENEALNATEIGDNVWLPFPMFNALFLPYHCANHFAQGEASVRQICDWACFVQRYGAEVDWERVRELAVKSGYYPFYCCLNGIVKDCLGVPASYLPSWPCDDAMMHRVLDSILAPRKEVKTLVGKVRRYFSAGWKYRLVYADNMLASSFRLAKSYIRLHDDNAKSLWER